MSAPTRSSASQVYDLPMPSDDEERAPFMPNSSPNSTMQPLSPPDSLSVKEVLASKDEAISKPLKALVAVMLFQQFSGINAVMFYSVTLVFLSHETLRDFRNRLIPGLYNRLRAGS